MKSSKAKIRNFENLFGGSAKINDSSSSKNINVFTESKKGEYYFIPLTQLLPFSKQARQNFDIEKINQLAVTILKYGLRQPLTVIKSSHDDTKYEIVSGERRYQAAKIANLEKVPCIILQDINAAEEIAIIENIQREDLHPLELGKAYQNLINSGVCKTQVEVSKILDVSRSQVVEYISYLSLSNSVKQAIFEKKITTRSSLRKLMGFGNEQLQLDYIAKKKKNIVKEDKKQRMGIIHIKNNIITIEFPPLENISKKNLENLSNKLKEFLETIYDYQKNI